MLFSKLWTDYFRSANGLELILIHFEGKNHVLRKTSRRKKVLDSFLWHSTWFDTKEDQREDKVGMVSVVEKIT